MARIALRQPRGLLALVGTVVALVAFVGADRFQPTPLDQATARIVAALLERDHLAQPQLNDEVSQRWCRIFLKDLDPQKYYFEKADVEEFLAEDTTLDDAIHEGDISFAHKVFERFLKRSDERLAMALELLHEEHDFSVDEELIDDSDAIEYPANAEEARERWRQRIKYELLRFKLDEEVDDEEAVRKLTIRFRDQNRYFHQFDTTDLLEVYLSAMMKAVDPHSSYMNAKTFEDLIQSLKLELEGIGASLASEDGYAVVKEVLPGGAADKDGTLQPEDKIVAIIDEDDNEIDLVEKKLSDVVRQIRGPAGTKVRLIIQPSGTKERKPLELIRQKIELKEQHAKGKVVPFETDDGQDLKIGVINLPAFYGDTEGLRHGKPNAVSATNDCRALLEDFQNEGVDAVLIDLRGNGGGLLEEAISLSGLFIDTGPVVQVRDETGIRQRDDEEPGTAYDGPLVVLVNRFSASASEIFAGVIKDYGRGLVVGDASTFGKGTVQSIVPLNERLGPLRNVPNLGALRLTIQQFYRANGESTQIQGVTPHIHIPSELDHADITEGEMDFALEFDKVEPLPHDRFNRVPPELVAQLDSRTLDRRKASKEFQKRDERIARLIERKQRRTIPLHEEKFRAEFSSDDEDNDNGDENHGGGRAKGFRERPTWEVNYYNDEVIAIVADYVTLGSNVLAANPVKAATSSN